MEKRSHFFDNAVRCNKRIRTNGTCIRPYSDDILKSNDISSRPCTFIFVRYMYHGNLINTAYSQTSQPRPVDNIATPTRNSSP